MKKTPFNHAHSARRILALTDSRHRANGVRRDSIFNGDLIFLVAAARCIDYHTVSDEP